VRVATAAALLLAPGAAAAWPAHDGGRGLFEVRSALTAPAGDIALTLSGTGYRVEPRREPGASGNRDILDGGLQLSVGWGRGLETWLRFDAPLQANDAGTFLSPSDGVLGAKVELPVHRKWLHAGLAGTVSVPWGKRARGLSTGTWDPGAALLLTVPLPDAGDRTAARLHVNLGYRRFGDDRGRGFEGWPLYYLEPVYPAGATGRLDLRGAAEFSARRVTVFAELILDRLTGGDVSWGEGPVFVTPGFRYALGGSMSLTMAGKITLAIDDPATTALRPPEELFPDWQIGFALTWSRTGVTSDRDRDGVPDATDRCPYLAEDLDGVADSDGCPEIDADADGIPDEQDGCPEAAEDPDGDRDWDGCPDADVVEEEPAPEGMPAPAASSRE
jgi:hypothetical protein